MRDNGALAALLAKDPRECEVQAIIGINDGITCPASVRTLAETFGYESLRIARRIPFYHPKLYLFGRPRQRTVAWIGSANFTRHGFGRNIELLLETDEREVVLATEQWFSELWNEQDPDSRGALEEYANGYVECDEPGAEEERTASGRCLLDLTSKGKYRFQYFGEDRWASSYGQLARSVLMAFADVDERFLSSFARLDRRRVGATTATKRYLSRDQGDLGEHPPATPLPTKTGPWWMAQHLEDYHFFQGTDPHGGIVRIACRAMDVTYKQGPAGPINFQSTKRRKPAGFEIGDVVLVEIGTALERNRLGI